MIKLMKKVIISIVLVISVQGFLSQFVPELGLINTIQAASIKLNKTKKTIYEGNTYTLKVKGTNKKVKWSSSDKSVAKVNSKGKVTAKKNGTAIITAKVGKTKLQSTIKVRLLQYKKDMFYTLKEAAILYNTSDSDKSKSFSIDLDGDGTKDNIVIEPYKYKNEYGTEYIDYIYKLNGIEFLRTDTNSVYFVDLDKNDKAIEFIIPSPFPYDCDNENRYAIYAKSGDTMKFIEHIDISRGMRVNNKGIILVDTYLQKGLYITPRIYSYYYVFKDNKITKKKSSISNIKKKKFKLNSNKYYPWYMANNKKNYKKGKTLLHYEASYAKLLKYNIRKIPKGTKFKIVKFMNDEGEMYVKLSSGKKRYILNPYRYEHE